METIRIETFNDQEILSNWLKMAEIDLALVETIYSVSDAGVGLREMEMQTTV